MPRSYRLKLNKKFKGGIKEWEGFNHTALNLLMDENLTVISDIVLCLHEHIQSSWEPAEEEPDPEAYATPSKRRRDGISRDLTSILNEVSDDEDVSESETVEPDKTKKQRDKLKIKRNEAQQKRRDAVAAKVAEAKATTRTPCLRPSMLTDNQYEHEWIQACAGAVGGDILERLDFQD